MAKGQNAKTDVTKMKWLQKNPFPEYEILKNVYDGDSAIGAFVKSTVQQIAESEDDAKSEDPDESESEEEVIKVSCATQEKDWVDVELEKLEQEE